MPPQPDSQAAIQETFRAYRAALRQMDRRELLEHLTSINAQLEAQAQAQLARTIQAPLSEYTSSIDRLVLRQPSTDRRSSPHRDRGVQASQPSSRQQLDPQTSWAQRLAAKLVLSSARAAARRRSSE
jgi:hypothetical protein